MTHHPHIHMIVPGGGISLDGTRWVRCKPGFLLPVRVLSRLFRRLFLTALADAHAAGRLRFFGEIAGLCRRQAFAAHLPPLRRKNWFVYAKPPFAGPEAVLAYLAAYTQSAHGAQRVRRIKSEPFRCGVWLCRSAYLASGWEDSSGTRTLK